MAEKRYYWLKLNEDYFANPKIKKLRKIAGGDTFTIIYLKMQLLSVSNKGIITFEGIENTIEEELALKLDEQIEDVQLTMAYLKTQGLVECSENEYLLIDACKNIGSECESAERVRNFRERQKSLQSNNAVTSMKQSSISISDSISNNKEYNKENILKESSNIQETNSSSNTNLTSSTMVDIESVGPSSKTNALTREKLSITDTSRALENKPSHTNKLSVDSGKEIISFILKDNSEFKVTEDIYNEYKQLYPDINIMQELRSLKAWCISNPSKRKTRKGALRFINGWFLRRLGQYYNNTSNNNYKAKVETKPAQKTDWHFEKNGVIGFGK